MVIITERTGDIFSSPAHSILIRNLPHPKENPSKLTPPFTDACNTKGTWGKGVAAAFKKYSPAAYTHQLHHCTTPPPTIPLQTHQRSLVGTCLLIPPFPPSPTNSKSKPPIPTPLQNQKQFWIACLFTSYSYGKSVDSPAEILDATERAVRDLGRQIEELRKREGEEEEEEEEEGKGKGEIMGGCVSVRINSGLFGVEWERTREVLERGGVDMVVVSPREEEGVKGQGKEVGSGKGVKRKGRENGDLGGEGKRQTRLKFGVSR
ncbi:MAG: hypothetical protein Q9219_006030 [cf. Caloplaca sp. 3 TL-2023]